MPHDTNSVVVASDASSTDMTSSPSPTITPPPPTDIAPLTSDGAAITMAESSTDLSATIANPIATEPQSPLSPAQEIQGANTHAAGVASDDVMSALADDLRYTLTVAQALECFAAAHRKVPSARTIQRYCIEGRVAAQKIRTTYGSEWLINEISLAKLIESEPQISVVASDATSTDMASSPSPILTMPRIVAPDTNTDVVASDAVAQTSETQESERRSLAEVLIENARLVAQVEGKDAIITELKENSSFLREEVREARRTRDDVKNIAERMLDMSWPRLFEQNFRVAKWSVCRG